MIPTAARQPTKWPLLCKRSANPHCFRRHKNDITARSHLLQVAISNNSLDDSRWGSYKRDETDCRREAGSAEWAPTQENKLNDDQVSFSITSRYS